MKKKHIILKVKVQFNNVNEHEKHQHKNVIISFSIEKFNNKKRKISAIRIISYELIKFYQVLFNIRFL